MKVLLILLYSVVIFYFGIAALVGYTYGIIVIVLAVITFFFIDWENMPWLKLKWKN